MVRCAGGVVAIKERTSADRQLVTSHKRTEIKSSAIAPQDISEGGGELAHIPLCTIEAQIQVESLFIQRVGWSVVSVVMPVFSD